MNEIVKTDISPSQGLSRESADQTLWRSEGLKATKGDPGKVPAAELIDRRIAEERLAKCATMETEAIASYREWLDQFKRDWQIASIARLTVEARQLLTMIDSSPSSAGSLPVTLKILLGTGRDELDEALKIDISENSSGHSNPSLTAQHFRCLTNCLGAIKTFIQTVIVGHKGEIFQHSTANLRDLESLGSRFEHCYAMARQERWHSLPLSMLRESLDQIDLIVSSLIQEVLPDPDSITLTDLPGVMQTRLRNEMNKRGALAEREYRSSNEMRCLRLFREIQASTDGSFDVRSPAKKTSAQLAAVDVAQLQKILDGLEPRLQTSPRDKLLFEQLIREASIAAAAEEPVESVPAASGSSALDTSPSAEEAVEAITNDTRELLTVFLDQVGIQDQDLIEALLPRFSKDSINRLEQQLSGVAPEVVRLLIERTPETIYPENPALLKAFLKQWRQTLQDSAGLDSFLVFEPVKFPEHFCSVDRLVRTSTAATLLRNTRQQVTIEFYRNGEADRVPAPDAQQPEAPKIHPEQHLIDRLASFTEHPYIAYGILREGFYYANSYRTSGLPRSFRERLLKSVFETPVHPKIMRGVERELLQWGFLKDHSDHSQGTDGLLSISPIGEVTRQEVRELLLKLTDVQTRRTDLPKLPVKREE